MKHNAHSYFATLLLVGVLLFIPTAIHALPIEQSNTFRIHMMLLADKDATKMSYAYKRSDNQKLRLKRSLPEMTLTENNHDKNERLAIELSIICSMSTTTLAKIGMSLKEKENCQQETNHDEMMEETSKSTNGDAVIPLDYSNDREEHIAAGLNDAISHKYLNDLINKISSLKQ